ncbi:MAG: hypothetical protein J5892_00445 [Bacilli bacterium]|nr:hypothetical protein [Bacilli bacterium]
MDILLGYVLTYLYVFIIIFISKLFKKVEYSRKFIHIFVAFAYFIIFYFFKCSFHIMIIPATFIIINFLSYKFNIFKGMEREENNTLGTVFYAISMTVLSIITYFFNDFRDAYFIGFFLMAIGDGLAPVVASLIKTKKIVNDKTLSGSLTIFMIAVLLLFFTLKSPNYVYLLLTAVFATFIELYSKKGLDNILLPLSTSLLVYILFY